MLVDFYLHIVVPVLDVLHQKTPVTKTKDVIHISRLAAPSVVFSGKLKSRNYCWNK